MSVTSAELGGGKEALQRLKSTDAPEWLTPSSSLSSTARAASQYLFSSLKRYDVSLKSPFDALLVEGFDTEQIWQQIDLLSQPLLLSSQRQVRDFKKRHEEIGEGVRCVSGRDNHIGDGGGNGMDVDDDDGDDVDEDDVDEEEEEGMEDSEEERPSEDGDREREGEEEEGGGGIEDKFLKIKELEEFMVEDEAREYGLDENADNKKKSVKGWRKNTGDDEEDDDEYEDEVEEEDGEKNKDEGEDEDEDNEVIHFTKQHGCEHCREMRFVC